VADVSLLSDSQATAIVAAIVTGATGIGAVVKWCAGRIVRALDRNSDAYEQHAKELVRLGERVEVVAAWVDDHRRSDETPVEGTRLARVRVNTPVRGVSTEYSHVKRRSDDDER